jgi:hypothetical protein
MEIPNYLGAEFELKSTQSIFRFYHPTANLPAHANIILDVFTPFHDPEVFVVSEIETIIIVS